MQEQRNALVLDQPYPRGDLFSRRARPNHILLVQVALSWDSVGTCRPLFKQSMTFHFFLGCAVLSASFSGFGTVAIVRELLNPAGWQGLPQVQPVVRLGTCSQQAHRHRDTCMWYVHPAAGCTDRHRHAQHSRKQPQLPYLWLIRLKDSG